jgi:hypothetical protein
MRRENGTQMTLIRLIYTDFLGGQHLFFCLASVASHTCTAGILIDS